MRPGFLIPEKASIGMERGKARENPGVLNWNWNDRNKFMIL